MVILRRASPPRAVIPRLMSSDAPVAFALRAAAADARATTAKAANDCPLIAENEMKQLRKLKIYRMIRKIMLEVGSER